MYCPNCNAYNDNAATRCAVCGAAFGGQYAPGAPAYGPPFGAPVQEPTPHLSNALPIAALVVGILIGGVPGIIFGVLAFLNYNNYTEALQFGNVAQAEELKDKSKRMAVIGIVVSAVQFVLVITLVCVVWGVYLFVLFDELGDLSRYFVIPTLC